jgi:hypothetical protein
MNNPINLYLNLLQEALLDTLYGTNKRLHYDGVHLTDDVVPDMIDQGTYHPDRAHTMIGRKRMINLKNCIETCLTEDIKGDFIETGAWRGGACIFMRGILKAHNITNRKVLVADSFCGMPPHTDIKYPYDKVKNYDLALNLKVDLNQVQTNFHRYGLLDDQVLFIKGYFENTINKNNLKNNFNVDQLAVLRLDGDMYSSTICVLEEIYSIVAIGGFIIIDDYGLPACRKAVDDFRYKYNITTPMTHIDWSGVFWRKENA